MRNLLDNLAGRSQDKRLSVRFESTDAATGRVGLLPPPGEEIFVGTTIGEQVEFFASS